MLFGVKRKWTPKVEKIKSMETKEKKGGNEGHKVVEKKKQGMVARKWRNRRKMVVKKAEKEASPDC